MRYHADAPRLQPAGDAALLIELGDEIDPVINRQVHALARALRDHAQPGLGEAVPAYRSLLLHYDPLHLSLADVQALAQQALVRTAAGARSAPRTVQIPTCYGDEFGPDLEFVARQSGLTPDQVIRLHSSTVYPVYMLGFSPGFAYLGGLPKAIAAPRQPTPRTRVPAGSVGIAGEQTGIYPIETPGGWQLIGRTPLRLFDPLRDPPTLLQPGDQVRFVPINADEFAAVRDQEWATDKPPAHTGTNTEQPALMVLEPGLLTTVQDLGRLGWQRYGVPVCGAMDPFALRAANLLVGNSPAAAGLEMTTAGPILQATADCLIAVGGANLGLRVNGIPIPNWMSAYVRRGWLIEFDGRHNGCRAYLAVAGGIAVPPVMNSHSTFLRGGFGGLAGRALQAGDSLPVTPVAWHLPLRAGRQLPAHLLPPYSDRPTVEVIPGPQAEAFSVAGRQALFSGDFAVSPASDRMGYRLQGPAISHQGPADIISDGIALGSIQVPADQQPIVMLADRQTTGGYPKIGVVASADVPLLAQCAPGQSWVRFRETTVEEAQLRYRRMIKALGDCFA